jgi:HTH-type transcriptional repressor of NAD biosynthesis genes
MDPMRTGLTLGKYAPLHYGHQAVIETALDEMDHVMVIIYDCPETTSIPLNVRAKWIRDIYPSVEVLEAWDGPVEVGNTPEIREQQERFVLNLLNGRDISNFYSSEFYGEHMSSALKAENRLVDTDRKRFPVSATQVRADPYGNRDHLSPIVYRDLITNVVFLGAPSTGKTTLASSLAEIHQTVWMPEHGRKYWERNQVDRRLSPEQLLELAEEHLELEDKLLFEADRYLFTDTNALTTCIFAHYYHNNAHSELAELARDSGTRYDLVFVCDTDIPYDNTWDRSGDANRTVFQKMMLADLAWRKIPYFVLRGSLDERMEAVNRVLESFVKYSNPACLPGT